MPTEVATAGAARPTPLSLLMLALRASRWLLGAATGALGAVVLFTFLARWLWVAGLVLNFRIHLAALACVLLACALLLRSYRTVVAAAAVAVLALAPALVPLQGPTASGDGARLRLLTLNVLYDNRDYAGTLAYLQASDADIILLQETKRRWRHLLARGGPTGYPWNTLGDLPEEVPFSVLSRQPIEQVDVFALRSLGVAAAGTALRLEIRTPSGPLVVWNIHPSHPTSKYHWKSRNAYLGWLGERLADEPDDMPVIVGGDFNTVPWSPFYGRLLARGGFADAAGRRLQYPTRRPLWPVTWPILGVPIDHVLVSPTIAVRDYRVGPELGSDHLPVIVDLVLPGGG